MSAGFADLRDHLPSRDDLDISAITDRLPSRKSGKPSLRVALIGLGAVGVVTFAVVRRRRRPASVSASIYTPPLPKP